MATIGESQAINTLLDYLLRQPRPNGPVTDAAALDAARYLTERTQKTLLAGLTPGQVTELWPGRRTPLERA